MSNRTMTSHAFHGPKLWAASAFAGGVIGLLLALLFPVATDATGAAIIPLPLVIPFALLLICIAVIPLINAHFWHRHYPDVALFLGGLMAAFYLKAVAGGAGAILHVAEEYYAFMGLIGGLYVASAGIVIRTRTPFGPISNTILLAFGAVLANFIGTTGASVLLVRPFIRANQGRVHFLHIVFFIFLVSNCGGVLTPIGDPPLYLGYLRGVPFFWTAEHLWPSALTVWGALLSIFFVFDTVVERRFRAKPESAAAGPAAANPGLQIAAPARTLVLLALIVGCVFVDPMLAKAIQGYRFPLGPTLQIALAIVALKTAQPDLLKLNEFTWEPVKEVGILFAGIFLTMAPALAYLSAHGGELGVQSPTAFYFATGGLSAMLDNAPTYLNFLQIAVTPEPVSRAAVGQLIATPAGGLTLAAISTGAVFFGAMTYIGNGPNFMVRAIAESAGVRMPGFFGYLLWAAVFLLPVLLLHWAIFIR